MQNRPWVLLGDFNDALNLEDHSSSGYEPNTAMREFKEYVQAMEIDRIMGNLQFNEDFPGSFVIFQPYHILDHSLCVLRIPTRLKGLKSPFCKLLHNHGNLHEHVNKIRVELDEAHKAIDRDPSLSTLRKEHAHYLLAFKEAQLDEERFLKQKAKVPGAFVNHYNQFLGAKGATNHLDDHGLFIRILDTSKADFMVRDVTNDEVKSVIFSMGDDRATGPDRISDNILLMQELMRNYHRRHGPPRCAFKVDIQKAYDTVDWKFLESILVGFGFHPKMVQWIMVCVSGASYSISVNGNLHGWFKGKRGLRQGDPLSPYLFTLVMEILNLMLQRRVHNSDEFQYHHLCDQERIINLCFSDDLFLFSRGHLSLVSVIMDALEEFKQVSGLVPSIPKSTTFFCNVPNAKAFILNSMPFAEGALSVRYLGVPLISSRLLYLGCKILVEKLESRVNDWRNKFLSLAGQQLMHGFLWCQGEMKKGKAKVAWDSVYMPKHEGGLKVMLVGDGVSFSKFVLRSDPLFGIRFTMVNLHLFGLIDRDGHDWLSRFPVMVQLQVPLLLDDIDDVILWHDWDGVLRPFSVWSKVCVLYDMDAISPCLIDVAFIVPISKGKTVISILSRVVIAAISYYIWLERNGRLFKKKTSSPDQIVDVILSMVQLKLVTFKFKKMSTRSRLLLDQWKIPSHCIVHDENTR
ncbi:sodium/hydrogen exchanger 6 [Tanacetum coccineum]|uniref:Sodium/hydrogen exchanger 6 n=1 Tax=Tanacetum coccineum TaxID=301880 RepID=A0ABQ5AF37_9ASTR